MSEPHRLHPAAIVLMGFQIVRQFAIPALIPIVLSSFSDFSASAVLNPPGTASWALSELGRSIGLGAGRDVLAARVILSVGV